MTTLTENAEKIRRLIRALAKDANQPVRTRITKEGAVLAWTPSQDFESEGEIDLFVTIARYLDEHIEHREWAAKGLGDAKDKKWQDGITYFEALTEASFVGSWDAVSSTEMLITPVGIAPVLYANQRD